MTYSARLTVVLHVNGFHTQGLFARLTLRLVKLKAKFDPVVKLSFRNFVTVEFNTWITCRKEQATKLKRRSHDLSLSIIIKSQMTSMKTCTYCTQFCQFSSFNSLLK